MSRKLNLLPQQANHAKDAGSGKVPLKPKVFVQSARSAISPGNINTIANLSPDEKEKVTRLVSRLVKLEQEHEEVLLTLQREKDIFKDSTARLQAVIEEQIPIITEKLKSKEMEIKELETKNTLSSGLLALYQAKLKNANDLLQYHEVTANDKRIQIKRLESDLFSLQSLIASQKIAIESFEASRSNAAHSLQELQAQSKREVERLEAEKSDLTTRLARAEQQVRILQGQLEQERRSRELSFPRGAAPTVTNKVLPDPLLEPAAAVVAAEVGDGSNSSNSKPQTAAVVGRRESHATPSLQEDIAFGKTIPVITSAQTEDVYSVSERMSHQQQQHQHFGAPAGDIYDPLYASFDTTISFTSSHHYQHSRNEIEEDSVLADSVHEGGEEAHDGAGTMVAVDQVMHHHPPSSSDGQKPFLASFIASRDSWEQQRVHTALDPTPMKRRSDRQGPARHPPVSSQHGTLSSAAAALPVDVHVGRPSANSINNTTAAATSSVASASHAPKRAAVAGSALSAQLDGDAHSGGAGVGALLYGPSDRDTYTSTASALLVPASPPAAAATRPRKLKVRSSQEDTVELQHKSEAKKKKVKLAQRSAPSAGGGSGGAEGSRPAKTKAATAALSAAAEGESARHNTFNASHAALYSPSHPPTPITSHSATRPTSSLKSGPANTMKSNSNKSEAIRTSRTADTMGHTKSVHSSIGKKQGNAGRISGRDLNYDDSLFTLLNDLDIS